VNADPCVPENARNCREIDGITILREHDGAPVEGQAHGVSLEPEACHAHGTDPAPGYFLLRLFHSPTEKPRERAFVGAHKEGTKWSPALQRREDD
jgi:hypothetical protein